MLCRSGIIFLQWLSGDRLESSLKRETTGESTSFIRSINCYEAEMHMGHSVTLKCSRSLCLLFGITLGITEKSTHSHTLK